MTQVTDRIGRTLELLNALGDIHTPLIQAHTADDMDRRNEIERERQKIRQEIKELNR